MDLWLWVVILMVYNLDYGAFLKGSATQRKKITRQEKVTKIDSW